MLHSGRPITGSEEALERNERVGIVMDLRISEAWRSADGVWTAISSRIVLAQGRLEGGRGISPHLRMPQSLVCMHPRTIRRRRGSYADLQSMVCMRMMCCCCWETSMPEFGSSDQQHNNAGWAGVRGVRKI